jgi:DNA-binding MarR family transcriptional regulator
LEFKISETKETRETWELVLDLHRLVAEHVSAVANEFDLRTGQAQALQHLEPGRALTMGEVARGVRCDPSTITGIADRLESLGLVARGAASGDRRVKTLSLTPRGEALREKLLARLSQVPAELAGLPPGKQRALRNLLNETLHA